MPRFTMAVSTSTRGEDAGREAARRARAQLGGARAALALAFASPSYDELESIPGAIADELGAVPLVGGTAGGAVFDGRGVARRGVLVALLGGDDVRASTATAPMRSPDLVDVVPAAAQLLRDADEAASEGFQEALCLAFAPGVRVCGEALVAAVRKGTSPRVQLAGGLTGDDFAFERPRVFAGAEASSDRVALAGVYTRAPAGVAACHGWRPVGPARRVTRSDGPWLVQLDGRRALEAWVDDVRAAGGDPPRGGKELVAYLANYYELGLDVPPCDEPLVRAPMAVRDDGAVKLAGSIADGTRVHVVSASAGDMLEAAERAARIAAQRVGGRASGVLLLPCSGRLAALGDRFREEPERVARALEAPIAGACVFGEVARAHRQVDAFHNSTAVVVAWPA